MRASSVIARWSREARFFFLVLSLLTVNQSSKINSYQFWILLISQSRHGKGRRTLRETLNCNLMFYQLSITRTNFAKPNLVVHNVKFLHCLPELQINFDKTSPSTGRTRTDSIEGDVYLARLQIDFRFRVTLDYTARKNRRTAALYFI